MEQLEEIMISSISERIWCEENRPIEADIWFSLDPADWYELRETDAWKEVVRLVEAYGSRDNLLRRLEELDLQERATTEQVQTLLDRDCQAIVRNIRHVEDASKEPPRRPIWQRLMKWIRGDGIGSR